MRRDERNPSGDGPAGGWDWRWAAVAASVLLVLVLTWLAWGVLLGGLTEHGA